MNTVELVAIAKAEERINKALASIDQMSKQTLTRKEIFVYNWAKVVLTDILTEIGRAR